MPNDYDSFAEAYSAETEANLINGYYARPAILALAGDVADRGIQPDGLPFPRAPSAPRSPPSPPAPRTPAPPPRANRTDVTSLLLQESQEDNP